MIIPAFTQETAFTCGPAAMRMILSANGLHKSERQVAKLLHTNHIAGTKNQAFPALAEALGWEYAVYRRSASLTDMRHLLKQKFFLLVSYFLPTEKVMHYAIVKQLTKKTIILLDPSDGLPHSFSLKQFETQWQTLSRMRGSDREARWLFAIRRPTL